jgi:hypothetical protein
MYNNYEWERKYSFGVLVTLPAGKEMNGIHTMLTSGIVMNTHNPPYTGTLDTSLYDTNDWGYDLGIQIQTNRFTAHITVDVLNFMRYVEIGAGYCFSLYK